MATIENSRRTTTLDMPDGDSWQNSANLREFLPERNRQTEGTDHLNEWEKERQRWAKEHAHRLRNLWEQWQRPLGINSQEYYNYAAEDLLDYYDDPLRRSFIESLC